MAAGWRAAAAPRGPDGRRERGSGAPRQGPTLGGTQESRVETARRGIDGGTWRWWSAAGSGTGVGELDVWWRARGLRYE